MQQTNMPKKRAKKPTIFEKDKESEFEDEPEEFLEPEEHAGTHTEHRLHVSVGKDEENVYTAEGREEMEEGDEIVPWEEGFAEGAEETGELGSCAHCGKVLGDRETNVFEREYKDELMLFCSEKCARAGPFGKKKE